MMICIMVQSNPGSWTDRITVSPLEAARLLSISERKMHYLLADGTIPSVRIGRRRLVRVDDLRAFVDGCEVATSETA